MCSWCSIPQTNVSLPVANGSLFPARQVESWHRLESSEVFYDAGAVATGAIGVWSQLACLTAAVAPAALAVAGVHVADPVLTHVLVGGLVASRFGLWLFDLCVSQLLQELVRTDELGALRAC